MATAASRTADDADLMRRAKLIRPDADVRGFLSGPAGNHLTSVPSIFPSSYIDAVALGRSERMCPWADGQFRSVFGATQQQVSILLNNNN